MENASGAEDALCTSSAGVPWPKEVQQALQVLDRSVEEVPSIS
jgi:hypothetical protein